MPSASYSISSAPKLARRPFAQLVAIGMPAIERLIEGDERGLTVRTPAHEDGRYFLDAISELIGEVSRVRREEFVAYALAKRDHAAAKELIA